MTVPILHCSWTGRGHTILDRHILRGYRATRVVRSVTRRKLFRRGIKDVTEHCVPPCVSCCEVVGAIS